MIIAVKNFFFSEFLPSFVFSLQKEEKIKEFNLVLVPLYTVL